MNLTSLVAIKSLLRKHNVRPSKHLGQNFLIDEKVLEKIIDAAELNEKDIVLEVGAGLGTLTIELAKRVNTVIAVEKDKKIIPILKKITTEHGNIKVIGLDILKLPDYQLPVTNYRLVGNIPYYLTSALIRKFLETDNPPKMMLLMLQKEVAQRVCAKPPDMSLLSVSVQFYAKPEIISYVSRSSFWPMPEVDSAILKITDVKTEEKTAKDKFFTVVKAGFSSPRKQLVNNLSKGLKLSRDQTQEWLEKSGIEPERRAETLSVEEWKQLAYQKT